MSWNWIFIYSNPNIILYQIETNIIQPWEWVYISMNSTLTLELLEKYHTMPWDWDSISKHPNLTMEFIEKHPDKPWNWIYISCTLFAKDKELFILQYYREHLAAFRIQQYYTRAKYNPAYKLCRKLHMKFYSDNFT